MKNLSIWLPPFSPDYSGAASVMFDFNALTAMHDASGCTGNYTGYDEPRWYNSEKNIFCSGLREIDAVLGNDDVLIHKVLKAIDSLKPEMAALIGTPVPMLIGTDLKGLAKELESLSRIPSIGIETTGTAYYDKGIFFAWKELIDKFADQSIPVKEKTVNILGANPIDFVRKENIDDLKKLLQTAGYTVNFCAMEKLSTGNVKNFYRAQIHIAVSQAGFLLADYLYKKRAVPYIAGYPVGEKDCDDFIEKTAEVCKTKKNRIWDVEFSRENEEKNILFLGEQVFCNSLRRALKHNFGIGGIVAGTVFGLHKELAQNGDVQLSDEAEIKTYINENRFTTVIGDPFFKKLLKNPDTLFIEIPHFGISSKFHRKDAQHFIGKGGTSFLSTLHKNLQKK